MPQDAGRSAGAEPRPRLFFVPRSARLAEPPMPFHCLSLIGKSWRRCAEGGAPTAHGARLAKRVTAFSRCCENRHRKLGTASGGAWHSARASARQRGTAPASPPEECDHLAARLGIRATHKHPPSQWRSELNYGATALVFGQGYFIKPPWAPVGARRSLIPVVAATSVA